MTVTLLTGDVRDVLATLPAESVHCVVTSPPYWGLRDYGTAIWEGGDIACDHDVSNARIRPELMGCTSWSHRDASGFNGNSCRKCGARRIDRQLGLEATPEEHVANMVDVFRAVRRVLRKDGTCWVNYGDCYASGGQRKNCGGNGSWARGSYRHAGDILFPTATAVSSLKPKDLVGMPWRVAFALQADGWWLRSDIIWAKPNPMPESVTDRPTKSHEYVFLLTKSARYFYDADAVKENAKDWGIRNRALTKYSSSTNGTAPDSWLVDGDRSSAGRNLRSVWTIATHAYSEAHFATFPPKLAETCIKAGCPRDGAVLDPFAGAGTTLMVADRLQRHAIGIDLNTEYAAIAVKRIEKDQGPLFAEVVI